VKLDSALAVSAVGMSAFATFLCVTGCGSNIESPGRAALRPVSLPDVAQLVNAPVRDQLRQRYSTLMSRVEDSATKTDDLGREYGEMGRLLLAAEYFVAAEPCFLNAQALVPDDMRWAYYLGHVYRLLGDTLKSTTAFERARALRPEDEATLVWLGKTYLDSGRAQEAEPLFSKALSLNSRSAASLYGLGRVALGEREYKRAAEYLERAKQLDERASVLHYPLAMAYRGLGQTDRAEAEVRQRGNSEVGLADPLMDEAIESLETAAAYEMRALRASRAGDWKGAASQLRKGIELAPTDGALRGKLGIALSTAGDRAGAEEEFEAAIRLAPDLAPAHLNLGLLMASSGRTREALEEFAAAVKYAPDDLQARFHLAEGLRQSRRAQEALSHYEHVLKVDPNIVEARFGYAMSLVLLKRYAEARERLTEDAKRYPDRPEFGQALGHLK
jgi:tetratricopeptide (TPR) repeat protein